MGNMQRATRTVVGGKVVTIRAREDETFVVPPELETELLESIGEAERGEAIPADELLRRLRSMA